ncbi:hypothetical protein HPB49_013038 [Dermacentor silvarum]|uniref:Uncharacterized protein n=1 Tax=Dermacentor silvarum TaxID=543639 RepID=A0ACB8D5K2_DERSI|nr:hypothetical protein HPB49_013038 [Dermacentor silvarum]
MMTPLSTLIFLLCGAGALCALPQDSNNFIDAVLSTRLPTEVRNRNLDPAPVPNFEVNVKKTFVTNRNLKADFTSGIVYGLSLVRRRGDCGAPAWEATNTTFGCHVSLDGVRVSYKVKAKGHKVLGSTSYSVDMFIENTNFFVEVTSARFVGCYNRSDSSRRKNKPTNTNFFRISRIVVDRCERSKTLSTNRRTLWLARINRADLDPQNPNLRVCGAHFVTGTPSDFFDSTNPDWAPSLHLGYSIRQAGADRYERSELRRQRKRRQRKTGVCTPDNLATSRAV